MRYSGITSESDISSCTTCQNYRLAIPLEDRTNLILKNDVDDYTVPIGISIDLKSDTCAYGGATTNIPNLCYAVKP